MQKTLRGIQYQTQVMTPFMEFLKGISNKSEINNQKQPCMEIVEAIEDQQRMGLHLMLRGFLSKKWNFAISKFIKERVQSKVNALVLIIWKHLFGTLWSSHNNMLHSETSYVVQRENETMNKRLQMFWEKHRELVHYSQYQLIDYDDDEVILWSLQIKK